MPCSNDWAYRRGPPAIVRYRRTNSQLSQNVKRIDFFVNASSYFYVAGMPRDGCRLSFRWPGQGDAVAVTESHARSSMPTASHASFGFRKMPGGGQSRQIPVVDGIQAKTRIISR
jgi:hypothetical protein